MWETWVRSLGREDPLEKEMATHSSILAWRIPWTEEPGGLPSTGSQRVGHDWATSLSLIVISTSQMRNSEAFRGSVNLTNVIYWRWQSWIWTQGCLTWIELSWHILFSNLWIYFLDSHTYWIRKSQSLFIDYMAWPLHKPPTLLTTPWSSTISDMSIITKMIFISKNSTFHCRHTVNALWFSYTSTA